MTQYADDMVFDLAVSEIANILSLKEPSDIPIELFGFYDIAVKMLREDARNDPTNIEITWNFIKSNSLYAGLVLAIEQGFNRYPNNQPLNLPQILQALANAGDESAIRQTALNLTVDVANLSTADLLQVIELATNKLNISKSWIADWRKAIVEIQQANKPPKNNSAPPPSPPLGSVGVAGQAQAQVQFHTTDLGNAKRLVAHHGKDLRFVHVWDQWLVWNGIRWEKDETGEVQRRTKQVVLNIYNEAASSTNDDERRRLAKWASTSEGADKINSTMKLAQSELGIPVRTTEIDQYNMLLNCKNGTVDLSNGQLGKPIRSNLITRSCDVIYDPKAECPLWLDFLNTIMAGNQNLIKFLQVAVGYSLTGSVENHCLFFAYGTGRNGKSTFLTTIYRLLGNYAQKAPVEILMAKQHRASSIPNDIARLQGQRFVITSEVGAGQRLAESQVKDLTGGEPITARFMHGEFFDFMPTHHIWMLGNYRPLIRGSDPGIWSRVKPIPFTVFIPPENRLTQMSEILWTESSGIMNWAIQGCLEWKKSGLVEPDEIGKALSQYKEEMDIIGAYIEDRIILEAGTKTPIKSLHEDYQYWCAENGETPLDQRYFSQRLVERGFMRVRSTGGIRSLENLRLRRPDEEVT